MRRLDLQPPLANAPDARKQAPRPWPRGAVALGIVDPAVTGAHEQSRLGKPGDRTAQVGAVRGEHEELLVAHVVLPLIADIHPDLRRHAVPGLADRVLERHEPGLVGGETVDRTDAYPID